MIDCEELTLEAPNRLAYTWASEGQNNTVTWTLQELVNGKVNLHLEQSGITYEYVLENAKQWLGCNHNLMPLLDSEQVSPR